VPIITQSGEAKYSKVQSPVADLGIVQFDKIQVRHSSRDRYDPQELTA
jgi:hypothetical protein